MSAKHTPEPWVASREETGEWGVDSGAWGIATVADWAGENNAYDSANAAEANARLIAAAPDLLSALKLFAYIDETTGSDLWWIDKRRCIQARAAIAKATGETA